MNHSNIAITFNNFHQSKHGSHHEIIVKVLVGANVKIGANDDNKILQLLLTVSSTHCGPAKTTQQTALHQKSAVHSCLMLSHFGSYHIVLWLMGKDGNDIGTKWEKSRGGRREWGGGKGGNVG